MAEPEFTVDDIYLVRDRGPVLTSRVGAPAGSFHPGDRIRCGPLEATVRGVETFAVPGAPEQGLLVDADPAVLAAGQVWRRVAGREGWRHGHPIRGTGILLGTTVHCAGCGRPRGLAAVALTPGYIRFMEDHPIPDWPFDEATCPVCRAMEPGPAPEPRPWPKGQPRPLP